MTKTLSLRVGDKVKWIVGNVEVRGVVIEPVREEKEDETLVITHFIKGTRNIIEISAKTELLKLDY